MKPEEQARQTIDELLQQAGWVVQDYAHLNLGASLGIAIGIIFGLYPAIHASRLDPIVALRRAR